ncbi:unnamed protein product [Mytilus coruscus]|uniref:Ig-like domain-containing protein n=1 Tax=Mytilus coruscus TaxID=42192 RepID=A0A6J8C294_MYTCO|nr:unnamed protein product [Mytilus coruscus]
MLWVLLNNNLMPHNKETNGTSEKYSIIYIKHCTPKTYHIIEGENFTITCEMRSLLSIKSVRWQKDGHDINLDAAKYKLNVSKSSLTIENISEVDGGTYTCIVSNRCVSFLSALLIRMKWDWASNHFKEYRKENQNSMAVNVHKLPTKYETEEKQKGGEVSMKPLLLLSEDIKRVVWYFKTEDIFRDVKLEQLVDTNDGAAEPDHHCFKYGGGTLKKPELVFKTDVSDNGHYICFVVMEDGSIVSFRWKLRVFPQDTTYEAVLQHRVDKSYVKTSTVDMAVECLKNNGFVVIVGRKGTGKSKMCLQLESVFLEEDYRLLRFDKSPDRRKIADLESTKIIFILDDITILDQRLDFLPEVSGNSKAKVICTCRQVEMATLKGILQGKKLYSDNAVIDLDYNILTLEEKKKILEGLSASTSSKLDEDLFNTIIRTEPFFGFPLKAKKFCSIEKHLQKGEKYFTYPPKRLRKEICDLYETSIKTEKPDLMNKYCVLAYIATDKKKCLDVFNIDLKRFTLLKKIIYKDTEHESQFNDVVDTLVWKYVVKTDNHTYRFIHPAVSKAVYLSSDHFTNYITVEGEIEDIIELIRSVKYEVSVDDLVLKLESVEQYHILCERLISTLIPQPDLVKNIGEYIYHQFIKMRDREFLVILFYNLVACFSIGTEKQKEIKRKEEKTNVNEENPDENVNQIDNGNEDISKTKNNHYLPFTMIPLMEHLTRTGIDGWIYTNEDILVPDCMVLYGLIMACKNTFHRNENKKNTFKAILKLFCKRCQEEHFQLDICKPMDIYGNVFCHYLTMFSEIESCIILTKLLKFLPELNTMEKKAWSKEGKIPYKVKNMLQESPMQLSAYLGKAKIFKMFWEKSQYKKKRRKRLLRRAEIGMRLNHGSGSSASEIKSFLYLDNDLSQIVLRGEKEGYSEILKILIQN